MAKKKTSSDEVSIVASGWTTPELEVKESFAAKIDPIAVDFGSEQLNNLARKLNEVIASLDK